MKLKLSRMEVCRAVPMAPSTFDIWRRKGRLETFTDGTLSNAKQPIVYCTLEALAKALNEDDVAALSVRLGLSDDEPEVTLPDVKFDSYDDPEPKPTSTSPIPAKKKLSPMEARAEFDAIFAEQYRNGEATDSAGNRIDGTNNRWPLQDRGDDAVSVTLIGPQAKAKSEPQDGASHMVPELRSDFRPASFNLDANSLGVTRHGSPLAPGLTQEAYDQMMVQWRGGKSEREKAEAQWAKTAGITSTWPKKDRT